MIALFEYGLAVWRLSHMLVNERGPFDVFCVIRAINGIKHDSDGFPSSWSGNPVLSCLWCTSVWVAGMLLLVPKVIIHVLSLSAIAILVEGYVGKSK